MANMDANEFYEDDEPVEKIVAAFERGEKRVTKHPSRGFNAHITLAGVPSFGETSTAGVAVTRSC
ncbi:hypothetical protein ACIBCT_12755 [Streptosporangium sp. NPDC050855]|uniref:hypothetical protein n=1 Tax=Streptosporangium sp. NPDC050855 TaxID=3366194 RepID=UPI0037AF42A2